MSNQISEIKSENKKQFKKFAIILSICAIIGGITGFATSMFGDIIKGLPEYLNSGLVYIIPYSICVAGLISFMLSFMLYKKSRKLYEKYDGENEELINQVENKIGYSMIINNINLILTFFFFGAGVILDDYAFDLDRNLYKFAIFFLSYILNIVVIIKIQQKIIDFEKIMNPEKKGSVYDFKFAEKWEESCDEAERLMIYKSSYKSFRATNMACIAIWLILIIVNAIWNTGVMPIAVVTIIWTVLICSYSIESIRLQRTGGK